jgi:hypothetical protein
VLNVVQRVDVIVVYALLIGVLFVHLMYYWQLLDLVAMLAFVVSKEEREKEPKRVKLYCST